jgi:hypothetical protein
VLRLSRETDRALGRTFTGACDASRRGRVLFVDDAVCGCFIRDWPPCRCARCIVLLHGLGELGSVVGSAGTLMIVG